VEGGVHRLQPGPAQTAHRVVTKQGNMIHVVKWTPELARPELTQGAAGDQPSGEAEEGPPLIWTREPSPGVGPLGPALPSTAQPGGPSAGHGRTEAAVSGAETGIVIPYDLLA
jgi:hypothetical protein